jgi:hypothetical protein
LEDPQGLALAQRLRYNHAMIADDHIFRSLSTAGQNYGDAHAHKN